MVTSDWLYFHWFYRYGQNRPRFRSTFWPMMNGCKLQLEHCTRKYIDILDAGNPMVTSDWSYLRWFCRYGQNRPGFPRFSYRMTNGRKTTVRMPFRKIYRAIRRWESNGNPRLAISSLVMPLWRKSPRITTFV